MKVKTTKWREFYTEDGDRVIYMEHKMLAVPHTDEVMPKPRIGKWFKVLEFKNKGAK